LVVCLIASVSHGDSFKLRPSFVVFTGIWMTIRSPAIFLGNVVNGSA
jgi:hypothetical protein